MSWRPYFDIETLDALRNEIADHPQGAGRGGLVCPAGLIEKALAEFGYVVSDGRTTGNCFVHAFTQSALAQGLRPSWKKMTAQKRCADARKLAADWAAKNRSEKFWGGWTFQEVSQTVCHQPFDKWLARLRLADSWGDMASLQALACSIGVDVLVVQSGNGPAKLLGKSVMIGESEGVPLVPVACHDFFHFWPLLPSSPSVIVGHGSVDADPDFDELEASEVAIGGREHELQLCEALSDWSPFDLPSPKLIESCKNLGWNKVQNSSDPVSLQTFVVAVFTRNVSGANIDNVPAGVMARARRFAIIQLAREDAAVEAG